jgi:hypothetical protein
MQGGKLSNAKSTKIKYVMALDGCVLIFHTQQPTKNMPAQWSGFMRAGETRGERAAGMIPLVLGALEVEMR